MSSKHFPMIGWLVLFAVLGGTDPSRLAVGKAAMDLTR